MGQGMEIVHGTKEGLGCVCAHNIFTVLYGHMPYLRVAIRDFS